MSFIYFIVALPIRYPVLAWLSLLKRKNSLIQRCKQLVTVWSSTNRFCCRPNGEQKKNLSSKIQLTISDAVFSAKMSPLQELFSEALSAQGRLPIYKLALLPYLSPLTMPSKLTQPRPSPQHLYHKLTS